jgi:hypothetical protein
MYPSVNQSVYVYICLYVYVQYINLLKPTGYVMNQQVEQFNNCTLCHTLFMCFVYAWEQTATCATYIKNYLVFITELESVYSVVRAGPLHEAVCSPLTLRGLCAVCTVVHCTIFSNTSGILSFVTKFMNVRFILLLTGDIPTVLPWRDLRCCGMLHGVVWYLVDRVSEQPRWDRHVTTKRLQPSTTITLSNIR